MQFSFPNAPTDNLYKFMAIFGLLFAGAIFIYTDFMEHETRKTIIEFANKSTDRFYNLVKGYANQDPPLGMAILQKEYKSLTDTDGIEMLAEVKRLEFYKKIRSFAVPITLFISIVGFILWYIKIQKYQDKILKNKATHHITKNRKGSVIARSSFKTLFLRRKDTK